MSTNKQRAAANDVELENVGQVTHSAENMRRTSGWFDSDLSDSNDASIDNDDIEHATRRSSRRVRRRRNHASVSRGDAVGLVYRAGVLALLLVQLIGNVVFWSQAAPYGAQLSATLPGVNRVVRQLNQSLPLFNRALPHLTALGQVDFDEIQAAAAGLPRIERKLDDMQRAVKNVTDIAQRVAEYLPTKH